MKKVIFTLVSACVLCSAFALEGGQPAPGQVTAMPIEGRRIVSGFESLSVALQVLERGYSTVYAEDSGTEQNNQEENQTFEAMVASLAAQRNEQDAASSGDTSTSLESVRILRNLPVENGAQPGKAEESKVSAIQQTPPSPKVDPYSAEGFDRFRTCAERTLPMLYAKLALLGKGEGYSAMRIEAAIASEQGNGEQVAPDGLACGKYLGKFGLTPASPPDEIKVLLALSSPGVERGTLKSFFLYSMAVKGKKLEAPQFWVFAWRQTSYEVAVRKLVPPSVDVLMARYRAIADDAKKSSKPVWSEDLDALEGKVRRDEGAVL